MDRSVLERYAAGGGKLAASIAGLSHEQLRAFPVPSTWSIQQIVLHLLDSDLIASDRMKRVIAEDDPLLIGFDESAFAKNLFYDQMDAQVACDIVVKNRQLTYELLKRLPDSAFARTGQHNERGKLTLADLVETYTSHLEHHLRFIEQKREMLTQKA